MKDRRTDITLTTMAISLSSVECFVPPLAPFVERERGGEYGGGGGGSAKNLASFSAFDFAFISLLEAELFFTLRFVG